MARKVILVVGLVLGFAWIVIARAVDFPSDSGITPTDKPTANSQAQAQQDPPDLAESKQHLRDTVSAFIGLYYSRNQSNLQGTEADRTERFLASLRPYASDAFFAANTTFVVAAQDEAIVDDSGSLTASVTGFDMGHDDEVIVDVTWTIRILHHRATKRTQRIEVFFSKQGSDWLIDGVQPAAF